MSEYIIADLHAFTSGSTSHLAGVSRSVASLTFSEL